MFLSFAVPSYAYFLLLSFFVQNFDNALNGRIPKVDRTARYSSRKLRQGWFRHRAYYFFFSNQSALMMNFIKHLLELLESLLRAHARLRHLMPTRINHLAIMCRASIVLPRRKRWTFAASDEHHVQNLSNIPSRVAVPQCEVYVPVRIVRTGGTQALAHSESRPFFNDSVFLCADTLPMRFAIFCVYPF